MLESNLIHEIMRKSHPSFRSRLIPHWVGKHLFVISIGELIHVSPFHNSSSTRLHTLRCPLTDHIMTGFGFISQEIISHYSVR